MNQEKQLYFLPVIERLRREEELVLYGNILLPVEGEKEAVTRLLQQEYEREAIGYPYTPPAFNGSAALWAAETVYTAAQLILYREHKPGDLGSLFAPYNGETGAAAILSADLCLRFLPELHTRLKLIDPEDQLLKLLEQILATWHYSGIALVQPVEQLDNSILLADPCLRQLYVNRIITCKRTPLAQHAAWKDQVQGNLGIFAPVFWKELNTATT